MKRIPLLVMPTLLLFPSPFSMATIVPFLMVRVPLFWMTAALVSIVIVFPFRSKTMILFSGMLRVEFRAPPSDNLNSADFKSPAAVI